MTKSELERLERIATQLMAGSAHPGRNTPDEAQLIANAIRSAKELIKQLNALKISE